MNASSKPRTPASAAPKSITLSKDTCGRVTAAGVAEGVATKTWRFAADGLIAEGVTPTMLGTVAKPDGLDGKANADITRQVIAAINASFSVLEQLVLGTERDAINVNAFDLMARFDGNDPTAMKPAEYAAAVKAIEALPMDIRKGRLAGIKARKTELQQEQSARLGKLRRYLIEEEEAAKAEANGTPRGPKSDGQRIHEMLDRILKMLQKHGEKKDATWDVVAATVAVRTLMKLIPKV